MLLLEIITVLVASIACLVAFYKWRFQYWKRKNFNYLQPSIPFGNLQNQFNRKHNFGVYLKGVYDEMKKKQWRAGGIFLFTSPGIVAVDLDVLKTILTKDVQYFVDRGTYHNEKDDPLSAHLFAIGGSKWRNLRTKFTPTFTSGKMKMMFQTLVDCEVNLLKSVEELSKNRKAIDIKDVLGCYTTDIIGSCAFGLDFNTFKEENSPFRVYGKKVFNSDKFRTMKTAFSQSFPDLARSLHITAVPKDVSKFFLKVVKDTVNYREKNDYRRNDFMQMLIDLKNNKFAEDEGYKHDGKSLTVEEIAAQSFVFFLAGFETSSTTMTFLLYEIARRQEIQEKLRKEVKEVLLKHGGKITYDAIQDMTYMNQVVNETLRKYPPVPFITRECVKDYKMSDPDVIIEKGTKIIVPILGIHRDPEYYPDPEKFDPERFSKEAKESRHQYAHIPFGEGPRICIGMRFGWMQSKVGLTCLLKDYKFTVNPKTKEPLKFDIYSFVLAAEGEIWLDAQKL